MNMRDLLVRMIAQLLKDMQTIQHQGAGYYTCTPFATRYNKLLAQAKSLLPQMNGLLDTFQDIPEADPKDPADKMKLLQAIQIECGQLTTVLQATEESVQP